MTIGVTCAVTEGRRHLGWRKPERAASDPLQGAGRTRWKGLGGLSEKTQLKKEKMSGS